MRTLMSVMLLFATAACSQSPTAPTEPGANAGQLRWDVQASSCAPVTPPAPLPELGAATISSQSDGVVTASWPYSMRGRSATLYARFVQENGTWAMCSWDVADI